jgi:hypothetical protein
LLKDAARMSVENKLPIKEREYMSAPATNRRTKVKNIIDNIKRSSDNEFSAQNFSGINKSNLTT